MLDIYIDADACPVKEDAFRVAKRYALKVIVVSAVPIFLPKADWIVGVSVGRDFDAVDNWIIEKITPNDIVITNDIPLSARVVEKQGKVIDPRGRVLDEDNIGEAVAYRELSAELRQRGELNLGPRKMGKSHRSAFLAAFDELINAVRKAAR